MKSITFFLFLFLFVSVYIPSHANERNPTEIPAKVLIEQIRSGGYVLYMRHGITKRKDSKRNKAKVDLNVCATQRNLTHEGIAQVDKIGVAIQSLNIPIGKVKSSPYCRTKDTARAVFGEFEVDIHLAFSIGMVEDESEKLGNYLLDSMLAADDSNSNTVFVGHTANLKDGLGIWPKPEGVVVVFKKEQEKMVYKGMINPNDWLIQ